MIIVASSDMMAVYDEESWEKGIEGIERGRQGRGTAVMTMR